MSNHDLLCSRGVLLLLWSCLPAACGPAEGPGQRPAELDVALRSQRGVSSHEAGSNCMACHQPKGLGRGLFTVAGTVWTLERQPQPAAVVTLYDGKGVALATLEVDDSGSFYTTEPLPQPGTPLFPHVRSSTSGASIAMGFSTASAACNMCHVGRNRLTLD